jgi:APA family basic amino acid/polyamine antiporter
MNTSPSNQKTLHKYLGIGFGIAIGIGGTIGIGILRKPAEVAQFIHHPGNIIFLWVLVGMISLVGGMLYSELGTRFPETGGPFIFASKAFGSFGGFIVGWSDWIFTAGTVSFIAISFVEYFYKLSPLPIPIGFLSSIIVILIGIMQWYGIQFSSEFQKWLSVFKTIGFLLFIVACFIYFYNHGDIIENMKLSKPNYQCALGGIVIALRAIYITYSGWNSVIYFTEEDKNPTKNIPKSVMYGIISVMIIYILMNVSIMMVLPLTSIANSTFPAADAAKIIFGEKGNQLVIIISLFSLIGILYANLLYAPRIIFAISRAKLFYDKLSELNSYHIPGFALISTVSITVLFCITGAFNIVVNISTLLGIVVDFSVYVSFLIIRKKYPIDTAHFRAKGAPFTPILMVCISFLLLVGLFINDTENSLYAFILLLIGIVVFLFFKRTNSI